MVASEHRTFVDSDGVTIHYTVWPCAKPRGIVQISHGQGDHSQRYVALAEEFVRHGFVVFADDHRGHGETWRQQWKGDTAKLGHLGPRNVDGAIDAIAALTALARSEYSGLPLVFVGHSMGSLFGQIALDRGTLDADVVIWSGTALRTPFTMNAGDLNAKFKNLGETGHEWLNRDVSAHHAFKADPLTFKANAIAQFGLSGALQLLGLPKPAHRDIPLLIVQGSADALGNEKSVAALAARYVKAGYSDVELIVYGGARHEIYFETNRDEVWADVFGWLDARLEK
ncbi:MAG: hypothetical protein RLZZ40_841 [Actinomycetota bacterium]